MASAGVAFGNIYYISLKYINPEQQRVWVWVVLVAHMKFILFLLLQSNRFGYSQPILECGKDCQEFNLIGSSVLLFVISESTALHHFYYTLHIRQLAALNQRFGASSIEHTSQNVTHSKRTTNKPDQNNTNTVSMPEKKKIE